ncbi:protein-L-isoaspartate O-methyltransferase [Burkholderiaceae bacterium UC74_6]
MNVEQARFNMIEQQIRPWDVLDASVLELLAVIRREDFVPAEHRALAFMDVEIPLHGGQAMLSPRVEARLLQELKIQRHEKVLEVGTGSGFMAALLGHKAQRVETMEIDPQLAESAAAKLKRAGLTNVRVHQQDGAQGLAAEAPFDAILLSGSVAEVPQALLAQLKIGGRLVAIVGGEPVMAAQIVTRKGEHEFETRTLFETVAPRLVGFAEKTGFAF